MIRSLPRMVFPLVLFFLIQIASADQSWNDPTSCQPFPERVLKTVTLSGNDRNKALAQCNAELATSPYQGRCDARCSGVFTKSCTWTLWVRQTLDRIEFDIAIKNKALGTYNEYIPSLTAFKKADGGAFMQLDRDFFVASADGEIKKTKTFGSYSDSLSFAEVQPFADSSVPPSYLGFTTYRVNGPPGRLTVFDPATAGKFFTLSFPIKGLGPNPLALAGLVSGGKRIAYVEGYEDPELVILERSGREIYRKRIPGILAQSADFPAIGPGFGDQVWITTQFGILYVADPSKEEIQKVNFLPLSTYYVVPKGEYQGSVLVQVYDSRPSQSRLLLVDRNFQIQQTLPLGNGLLSQIIQSTPRYIPGPWLHFGEDGALLLSVNSTSGEQPLHACSAWIEPPRTELTFHRTRKKVLLSGISDNEVAVTPDGMVLTITHDCVAVPGGGGKQLENTVRLFDEQGIEYAKKIIPTYSIHLDLIELGGNRMGMLSNNPAQGNRSGYAYAWSVYEPQRKGCLYKPLPK